MRCLTYFEGFGGNVFFIDLENTSIRIWFVKNKTKIWLLGWVFFPGFIYAQIDIDSKLRDQFKDIITKQDLCHASQGYALDTIFEEARDTYQELMNCLFNDAMQQSVNRMHGDFRKTLSDIVQRNNRSLEDLTFKADSCSLQGIQSKQAAHGYSTLCETEGENPTVDEFYSACHVAETAMNEFCAYQEYLEWKKLDYESFSKEYSSSDFNYDYNERDTGKLVEKINEYDNELRKSKKTLYEMIFRYQKWEQNYRIHMWFISILDSLKETKRMLNELKIAVYQFPDKFNNAASDACECANACS